MDNSAGYSVEAAAENKTKMFEKVKKGKYFKPRKNKNIRWPWNNHIYWLRHLNKVTQCDRIIPRNYVIISDEEVV